MNRPQNNYGSITNPIEEDVSIVANRSSEFNNICENIVTNIYTINSSWKTLDTALKQLGTPKDNHGLRNQIHVTQLGTNQIASVTSKDVRRLKSLIAKGDKHQLLQVEKLEEDFKEAIGRYYSTQKDVATKQKANLLVEPIIENDAIAENNENVQKQAQMARDMAFEQEMMLERESRIMQIEADVLDVNEIMRELGSLVHEQGETIDSIENNIDHAVGNVEQGAEELVKAARYQNKRRRKLLCIVIIAIVIIAIILTIIFTSIKH